jgi:hypothetical protein
MTANRFRSLVVAFAVTAFAFAAERSASVRVAANAESSQQPAGKFRSVDSSSTADWGKIVSAFNVELQPEPPSSTV